MNSPYQKCSRTLDLSKPNPTQGVYMKGRPNQNVYATSLYQGYLHQYITKMTGQ